MGCSIAPSELSNLRRALWESPDLESARQKCGQPAHSTHGWLLKWGPSVQPVTDSGSQCQNWTELLDTYLVWENWRAVWHWANTICVVLETITCLLSSLGSWPLSLRCCLGLRIWISSSLAGSSFPRGLRVEPNEYLVMPTLKQFLPN